MPSLPVAVPHDHAMLAAALTAHGVCRLPGFQDLIATQALRLELEGMQATGSLRAAGTGQGTGHRAGNTTRGDSTQWMEAGCSNTATAYLAALHVLRIALNRRLFLGMDEVEAQFACYPIGASYQRHSDRFRDSDSRVLSLVSYLNEDWQIEQGGALRLYLPQGIVGALQRLGRPRPPQRPAAVPAEVKP